MSDALFPGANPRGLHINASRLSCGGRAQGGLYSHVGDSAESVMRGGPGISMKDFRTMLTAGSELRLRSDTEARLKSDLATVKKAYRSMERILLGDSTDAQRVNSSAHVHTSHTVKALGQAHSQDISQLARGVPAAAGYSRASSLLHSSPARKGVTTGASQLNEDDDEDDEDDNLNGKKGKGKTAFRGKPPLCVLSELLLTLDSLPPGLVAARDRQSCAELSISSSASFRDLYILSIALKTRTEVILDRAQVARVLKPKYVAFYNLFSSYDQPCTECLLSTFGAAPNSTYIPLCRLLLSSAPSGLGSANDAQIAAPPPTGAYENDSPAYASVSLCLLDARLLLDTATSHTVLIPRILDLNVSLPRWNRSVSTADVYLLNNK